MSTHTRFTFSQAYELAESLTAQGFTRFQIVSPRRGRVIVRAFK